MRAAEPGPSSSDPVGLPEGLRHRGRPLSVHRPWTAAFADAKQRLVSRFLGEGRRDFVVGEDLQRAVLLALGALMFCGGVAALGIYRFRPPQNEDPRILLIVAGVGFALCAVAVGIAIFHRPTPGGTDAGATRPGTGGSRPDLYLVYADGLAAVAGETFEFLAWDEVKEVSTIREGMARLLAVTAADGRRIAIYDGYTGGGELSLAIHQSVNAHLLPRVLERIAAGKGVKFGPFSLRKSGLKYKDREATWDDITSMQIQSHGGARHLTIHVSGRLLRWCWCDLQTVPNNQTFYDALCRTAPPQLLTTSTKPRW